MNEAAPEIKILNSALYGTLGGVLLLGIALSIVYRTPGDDPPAGLVMLNALAVMCALVYWFRGLLAILKLVVNKSKYRTSRKAIASYILLCILPVFFLVRAMVAS